MTLDELSNTSYCLIEKATRDLETLRLLWITFHFA
jgi:hypothetical protein